MNELSDKLPLLAIETSGELCSVALMVSKDCSIELNINKKNVHSEKLLSCIDSILILAELTINDIKGIAVSIGPGSFTGLRIGLSIAKGIAFGKELPIIPVSTFDALAMQISENLPDGASFAIANKVNREEVYFEKFQIAKNTVSAVETLKLLTNENVPNYLLENDLKFGNFFNSKICFPSANFIAKQAYYFGDSTIIYDFDFLEPDYLKNFIVKAK